MSALALAVAPAPGIVVASLPIPALAPVLIPAFPPVLIPASVPVVPEAAGAVASGAGGAVVELSGIACAGGVAVAPAWVPASWAMAAVPSPKAATSSRDLIMTETPSLSGPGGFRCSAPAPVTKQAPGGCAGRLPLPPMFPNCSG